MMGENKYGKGRFYKVVDMGYNKCYAGSTCEELSKRMARHREDYKKWKNGSKRHYYTLFGMFDDFNIENCKIELIEYCACNSKEELLKREGYHIQNINCINKSVAGRTNKEYKQQNWDKLNKPNICECGGKLTFKHKSTHLKTKRHQQYLQQMTSE